MALTHLSLLLHIPLTMQWKLCEECRVSRVVNETPQLRVVSWWLWHTTRIHCWKCHAADVMSHWATIKGCITDPRAVGVISWHVWHRTHHSRHGTREAALQRAAVWIPSSPCCNMVCLPYVSYRYPQFMVRCMAQKSCDFDRLPITCHNIMVH